MHGDMASEVERSTNALNSDGWTWQRVYKGEGGVDFQSVGLQSDSFTVSAWTNLGVACDKCLTNDGCVAIKRNPKATQTNRCEQRGGNSGTWLQSEQRSAAGFFSYSSSDSDPTCGFECTLENQVNTPELRYRIRCKDYSHSTVFFESEDIQGDALFGLQQDRGALVLPLVPARDALRLI